MWYFKIKSIKPYSTDYQTVVDEEQNNESSKKTIPLEEYDTDLSIYDEIIIGSPV